MQKAPSLFPMLNWKPCKSLA